MRFLDQVVIIGGAAGGIGRAIAIRLASEGAHVIAVDRDPAVAEAAEAVIGLGRRCVYLEADLSQAAVGEEVAARAAAAFGRVDIAMNCTGTTAVGPVDQVDDQLYHRVIDTELKSCYNLLRPAIREMTRNSYGRVLTIASRDAYGARGRALHAAAKAGVIGFTKTLALEVGRFGVTVNALSPYYVETAALQAQDPEAVGRAQKATAVRRVGKPEDVAAAAAFLSAAEAGFITGQILSVCGGSNIGMQQW
jgi:3-oxoacyl-[acyl-carrier protein] reductase